MTNSILITGASGMVGTRLTEILLQKGCRVSHLGRSKRKGVVLSFVWNVEKQEIDPHGFKDIDTIVHLAGAGVADKRWTPTRKQEILDSRTKSTALLYDELKKGNHSVRTFVSASAIGYYGFGLEDNVLDEESSPGPDYLANVVVQWEHEVDKISTLNMRVVKIRIGIVLASQGGALVEMAKPVRWGVGAPLGSGRQQVSWIHLDDLCEVFVKAIEDNHMNGSYNAVAPNPVTNREMTHSIAKALHRPLWLPPVPPLVLRALVGEMADIVMNGSKVSCKKIQKAGYVFQFEDLSAALKDLLQPNTT